MNWLGTQSMAQVWVERVLNSLPEGLLIALFAWLLLRLIGRQNSGTRFAVWFMALIAVVGLSFFGGFKLHEGRISAPATPVSSHIVIPVFWAEVIFAAWALTAIFALARIAAGLWQVRVIRRSCAEVDLSQLDSAIAQTLQQHNVGRPVCLAVSERVKVPAAIGFWKPAIVLPTWTLRELAPQELNPILIHELTHLKRRDDWTNLFQKMARAFFFFHPAVWWIDSRLSLEREMACDDAVLANTGNPRAYASSLIDLLEKSCARRGWTMAQAAVHRAQELSQRIAQILDAKRPATTRVWKPALALVSVFSLACFALSYCAPRLIAFAPETSDSAARAANIKQILHADETATPDVQGQVVPASFHVPEPQHPAVNHKPIKEHNSQAEPVKQSRPQASDSKPAMTRAVEATGRKHTAPTAQMVVFVETAYISYGRAENIQNPQTDAPEWRTQVWQILLIAPAQNASQMEIVPSII